MQPPSHSSSPAPGREYSRPTSRRRVPSERPGKYEVPPVPRHVVRAEPPLSADELQARHARRRRRLRLKRRLTMTEWIGFGASCVACAFLLPALLHAESSARHQRAQVREKQAQLASLERQTNEEKSRLAHLKSEAGRDQLLAERGYVAPGTRILIFPEDKTAPPSP